MDKNALREKIENFLNENSDTFEEFFNVPLEKKWGENELDDAVFMLILQSYTFYNYVIDAYFDERLIKMAPFARGLIECHATVYWILEQSEKKDVRARKFIASGEDLYSHLNSILTHSTVKRTKSRLPTIETRMKSAGGAFIHWYDELNYFVHSSSAYVMWFYSGHVNGFMDISMILSSTIYLEIMVLCQDILELSEEKVKLIKSLKQSLLSLKAFS